MASWRWASGSGAADCKGSGLPISLSELVHDIRAALFFNLAHDDITVYNAVQKLLYIGVILAAILMLVSGLAIWKPVQFQALTWLFYDFQGARLVHFLGMSAIALFLSCTSRSLSSFRKQLSL